jgi:hypothetical protein
MFLFVMDLIDIFVFKGKSEIKQIFIHIGQKLLPKFTYAYFSPQIPEEDDIYPYRQKLELTHQNLSPNLISLIKIRLD